MTHFYINIIFLFHQKLNIKQRDTKRTFLLDKWGFDFLSSFSVVSPLGMREGKVYTTEKNYLKLQFEHFNLIFIKNVHDFIGIFLLNSSFFLKLFNEKYFYLTTFNWRMFWFESVQFLSTFFFNFDIHMIESSYILDFFHIFFSTRIHTVKSLRILIFKQFPF